MKINAVRAYRGNPLIERLGPIRSQEEWLKALNALPPISDEEREAPGHYRIHSSADLTRVFIARPDVIDLAMHIDIMLRQGYVCRNPKTRQRTELLNSLPKTDEEMQKVIDRGGDHRIISSMLMGFSGVGKSISVEKILENIDQKIYHDDLGLTQVSWLKIEMPSDGGAKQLALSFFYALEKVLGHELPYKYASTTSTNLLLINMARLSAIYSIGILAVDEVQNLTVKHGNNRESMLNVLQTICNIVHVPLFMIGTMKAQSLFSGRARHARRASAFGSFLWTRLEEGREWDFMLNTLWNYQWTTYQSELSDEMRSYLHIATQGLMALLPLILMLAQHRAINSGQEKVTLTTLEWVYKKRFKTVHPMLEALRSGDPLKIIQFEDHWLPDFLETVNKEQAFAVSSVKVNALQPAKNLPPRRKAAIELAHVGFDLRDIEVAIDQAIAKGKTTASQLVREARFILENVKQETDPDQDDLRNGSIG